MSTPRDSANRPYDRPHQPWTCGLACAGRACSAGPSPRGDCPGPTECSPLREGDRWVCNRSPLRGGPCETGPSPDGHCGCSLRCTPMRSLRVQRGRCVAACFVLAASLLLLVLNSSRRNEVIAPGPLTSEHAQLLRRAAQPPQCDTCHAAAENGLGGWAVSLVVGHNGQPTKSALCMECHSASIPKELALAAHNVPTELLTQLRNENPTPGGASSSPRLVVDQSTSFACATCHQEHRGADHDLSAMSDRACQSCHQQTYHSFATDHPDFVAWPYERRTPIAFDHRSHQLKHFLDNKQEFTCRQCHVEDVRQSVQLLVKYETACASCHEQKIATSVERGVPMLSFPTLDVAALRAAGHDIGLWPAVATGDFDGRLPPSMKLLLSADPVAAQAMQVLGPNFEFFDVDAENREHLAACADLAAAMKRLVAELSELGAAAVRRRLSIVAGRELSIAEAQGLMNGLSIDTLNLASSVWLGGQTRRRPADSANSAPAAGAWYFDPVTLSVRYLPTGHEDTILTAWLSLAADAAGNKQAPITQAMLMDLAKPSAPGLCASCHSIEQLGAGRIAVHWSPRDRSTEPRGFTKFSHGPHVILPELADCSACHAVNRDGDSAKSLSKNRRREGDSPIFPRGLGKIGTVPDGSGIGTKSYETWDPRSFVSDFQPLSKQTCAQCHTSKAAGDKCQLCHNYHVTAASLALRVERRTLLPQPSTLNSELSALPKTSNDTRPARR